jgi:Zn-dependent protease
MTKLNRRHLRPNASEVELLEATVGPGRYRVLTRWPLTIALGPRAYAPALWCGLLGFAVGVDRGGLTSALIAGAIAGVAIAVAVAAHEAGHLLFGRHVRGLVPRILLLRVSGGASIVEGRFESPGGAAAFAAGGPIASAILTVVYFVAAVLAPWPAVSIGLFVPAVASALLLFLNLLPVAPTDGYALFRSLLWAETGSRQEAERRALAWSRVVLVLGLIVSLELVAHHPLAAAAALIAVGTLTVQHHAVARRVDRE